MSITNDDLRAAVSANYIDEKQAAVLTRLADERQGFRAARSASEEPFEMFKGFNEIFIVVGLTILYIGWTLVVGISSFDFSGSGSYAATIGVVQIIPLVLLTMYFTQKRRMIAPSILLSILMGLSAILMGLGVATEISSVASVVWSITTAVTTIILALYWFAFRIPFSIMLTGLSLYAFAISFALQGDTQLNSIKQIFDLTSQSNISLITLFLGISAFAVALWFDMSDPHRVTRRSANGFWLNVLAAPAIINSVALTLYVQETALSTILLCLFLALMAMVAVIIDRRSFLLSGIGYMIALVFGINQTGGGIGLLIFLIGAMLVLLGANWERLRAGLMNTLPTFLGKDKMPPWNIEKVLT